MKTQHSEKTNNTNQLLIICEKCSNKKFSTKKALQLHQIRTHTIAIGDSTDR
jgi:5-methylcytosine-specific restriction endonuclease McrA